ncbi:hypothetical protein D3C76_1045060 [compost metagenome]
MLAQYIQPALDPTGDGIAPSVHHGIDEILGLVLLLRVQHGVEHFPAGAYQRVFPGPANDHDHHEHRKHRCPCQPEKTRRHHQGHPHQQNRYAQLLRNTPGEEDLREDRQGLHHRIDQAKHLGLSSTVAERLCHQPRLFEVQESADTGQQHHEYGDTQQIGRAHDSRETCERIAAQRPGTRVLRFGRLRMAIAPLLQVSHRANAAQQKHRRQQHQAGMPDNADQDRPQDRADQPPQARTRGQQTKQALALLVGKQVGQHAPGQGDRQKIEHRQPDIKGTRSPEVVRLQRKDSSKRQQVACQETIGPVQDAPTLDP